MDEETVVYTHNGMLLSHKRNTYKLVLLRWVNLEIVIQSEVSKKEKNECSVLMPIYGI